MKQTILLLALLLTTATARAASPSLLLTPQSIAALKDRIAADPQAAKQFAEIKMSVDAELLKPVELPPRGGNWYHWYVCPKHGNRLTTGKRTGKWTWEHVCPVDKETFKGDPTRVETDFDGCALSSVHRDYAQLVQSAGIVHQITGDAKYAAKARDVLLAYANQYADYPLHTIRNEPKLGGGKTGAQTLDESTWAIPAVQGADLIWPALSTDERNVIANKLFGPLAREVVLPHRMGVHNIQCWKNSAVGLIGFLLEDQELIKSAIDDPQRGFRQQIKKGITPDGQWWEGAWGYHFYTMQALWPLAEAARNNGIDLYTPEYRKMFDAPIAFARPDMVLPDFSDSHEVNVPRSASLYELGLTRFGDARYAGVLRKGGRANLASLLFGVKTLPDTLTAADKSANYPQTGYAILRKGDGENATWLCLKYGPHGGGHGHPDKLSFVLYAGGKVLVPDGGITSYGTPLHQGWYRTTLAHNTLIVDESNQKDATGQSLDFSTRDGVESVTAAAGAIYPGVRYTRTVSLHSPRTLTVVDRVEADDAHTFDFVLHHYGQFAGADRGQPWPTPDKPGYKYLKDARVRPLDQSPVRIGTTSITLGCDTPAQLITATGPGHSTAERVPVIMVRTRTRATQLTWRIDLRVE